MEWNFLVYLWLRVEEHRLHELINFWNNRPDVVLISPISPIKKHRKKEKKKTCREHTSGIHADFLFKKGRVHCDRTSSFSFLQNHQDAKNSRGTRNLDILYSSPLLPLRFIRLPAGGATD